MNELGEGCAERLTFLNGSLKAELALHGEIREEKRREHQGDENERDPKR
jgi:hypothetical protein